MTFTEPPSKEMLVLIIALIIISAVSFTATIAFVMVMLIGLGLNYLCDSIPLPIKEGKHE